MQMKTQAQKSKSTSQRLLKTYGITLAEYDEMLEQQGGVCAICHRPPVTVRLSVDHDHAWKRVRIITEKVGEIWKGFAAYNARSYHFGSTKRGDVVRRIKQMLLRASIRGLLCVWCNRGLQRFRDSPEALEAAAQYLRKHQEGK
jgi:hypothetical protein